MNLPSIAEIAHQAADAGLNIVPFAVPLFVLAIVLEMVWAARHAPGAYEPGDTLTSLSMGLGSTIASGLVAGAIVVAAGWLYAHRVATVPVVWWAWIAVFVVDDFNYYWFHRTAHRVR